MNSVAVSVINLLCFQLSYSIFFPILASTCSSNQFQCVDGPCINIDKRCNEVEDCSDGSDEFLCGKCTCMRTERSFLDYYLHYKSVTAVILHGCL